MRAKEKKPRSWADLVLGWSLIALVIVWAWLIGLGLYGSWVQVTTMWEVIGFIGALALTIAWIALNAYVGTRAWWKSR